MSKRELGFISINEPTLGQLAKMGYQIAGKGSEMSREVAGSIFKRCIQAFATGGFDPEEEAEAETKRLALWLRAHLYEEFKALSAKEKTTVGGLSGFVQQQVVGLQISEEEGFHPILFENLERASSSDKKFVVPEGYDPKTGVYKFQEAAEAFEQELRQRWIEFTRLLELYYEARRILMPEEGAMRRVRLPNPEEAYKAA